MSIIEEAPRMADAFGVPEYFYTHIGKIEEAGGGCMRVYCCIKREGVLLPVFTVIMPADALGVAGGLVSETVSHHRRGAH
jgi:hypothetical protein